MMISTAYMTRGLLTLTGSSKRSQTERAEELDIGNEAEEIPMADTPRSDRNLSTIQISADSSVIALNPVSRPPASQDPSHIRPQDAFQRFDDTIHEMASQNPQPTQTPLAPTRAVRWTAFLTTHREWFIYLTLFLLVGLPIYFTTSYVMPLHLTLTVLCYFSALLLPASWRTYLHPVLVSAALTVLTIWIFAASRRQTLASALGSYRVGVKYLQLWSRDRTSSLLPGAGDILGSILDASIVSLALPMYQYRRELRQHFVAIVIPNVVVSIASLFAYPVICAAIGIGAGRSLAFAARSLTLALATPAMENLGGDTNTVAALAIMSGIVGALVGTSMLGWMRIPEGELAPR
jgi:putative effector of murein hydrolase